MKKNQVHNPPSSYTHKTTDFRMKYKTEKCKFWLQKGFCPYNQFCAFAHDGDEIRSKANVNSNYKTKPCFNYHQNGFCKYGDRCQYRHSENRHQKTRSSSEDSNSTSHTAETHVATSRIQNMVPPLCRLRLLKQAGLEMLELYSIFEFRVTWQQESTLMSLLSTDFDERQNNKSPDKKARLYSL